MPGGAFLLVLHIQCEGSSPPIRTTRWWTASLCKPSRRCGPATTRCKYVHVSSLMPSLASNGRVRTTPALRRRTSLLLMVLKPLGNTNLYGGAGLEGCVDRRVAREGDRELTGTYLQRVGAALQPCADLLPATSNVQPTERQTISDGTRTQPSIKTRALRLMMALVTVQLPSSCVASAPTRKVPEG